MLFFSYNPRRAELYLRKALYIREKEKQTAIQSIDLQKTANLFSNSSIFTSRSSTESQFLSNQQITEQLAHSTKINTNNDQNTIAEILFDLGGLLATFEPILSKKEAIECLRRSLDIKTLILGADHDDCKLIKTRLSDIIAELACQKNQSVNSHAASLSRETISILGKEKSSIRSRSNPKMTPISRNKKIETIGSNTDKLDEWIKKNSVTELISKSNVCRQSQSELEISHQLSQSGSRSLNQIDETKMEPLKRQKTLDLTKTELLPQRNKIFSTKRVAKCPTALSVDSNNEKYSLSGPRSSLKNLVVKNDDLKLKITKKIYYKSTWYDLPHGSNQNRFKRFVKLTPNS